MKYIKLIIILIFLNIAFTGCSYVSDYIEGQITNRASFSVTAEYSGGNVILNWDETDSSDNFSGIEIYRTSEPNNEYASYDLVASRYFPVNEPDLADGSTTTYTVSANFPEPVSSGEVYFYRVGIIHWDDDPEDRTYNITLQSSYNSYTDIDAISGYGKVVIP